MKVYDKRWFVPMSHLPVYTFDLYFAESYRLYDGREYVRARDNRQAKRKIRKLYPHVVLFQWGEDYAE